MTQELKGIAIILACYFLGEVISRLIGGFMPSSIIGMIILFSLLQAKIVNKEHIRSVANFVLKNMMLFFIPVTVGIVTSLELISDNWVGVVAAIIISTVAVLIISGGVQQILGRRWKK